MPGIRIQSMGGETPRVSPRLLPNGSALIARMTKLWSGEVQPFRAKAALLDALVQGSACRTVYKLQDAWLSWDHDVDVVAGFAPSGDTDRVYYTGDGPPKMTTLALAAAQPLNPDSYNLGVLEPAGACTVGAPTGIGTGPALLRFYVYTYVTSFAEEGVPSPPSAGVDVMQGQSVPLSDFAFPPIIQNIASIRVYRTEGGVYRFVKEATLAELSATSGVITDDVPDDELAEALPSQHWYPPRTDMTGLIGTAMGSLAGISGKTLCVSEPYQPHAWPPEYEKIFDAPIVALGTFGNSIVVATTGFTYIVSGSDPKNLTTARVPDPYPCVSKRSMVSADKGVLFASTEGLVGVRTATFNRTPVEVLTKDVLTPEQWRDGFNPSTIEGMIFEGRYHGFYVNPAPYGSNQLPELQGAGFIFDFTDPFLTGVDEDSKADQPSRMIEVPFYAVAMFASPSTPLHFVLNEHLTTNALYRWDAGPGFETYVWRSKQFVFPYKVAFAAAKVVARADVGGAVVFRLVDGRTGAVVFSRTVTGPDPFRLSALAARTDWIVEIEGTGFVQEVHVATSMQELTEGKEQ